MSEPLELEASVVKAEPALPMNLFGASTAAGIVLKATEYANALASVIRAKHLYKTIGQKNHVFVEGWTLCGSMLGVFPVCTWTRPVEGGWEARVEARTLSGAVVGAAEASCLRAESNWKNRDDFALRSMAQTRATSKAMRLPLGFIVVLAGYEGTPAEEMDGIVPEKKSGRGGECESQGAPVGGGPAQASPPSASGMSTEEHLAEAKRHREETAARYAKGPTPEHKVSETIEQSIERIKTQKAAKFGRPKSVPDFCPSCNEGVSKYESEDGKTEYWECNARHSDRKNMKEQGVTEAQIRKFLEGHFFQWAGKPLSQPQEG